MNILDQFHASTPPWTHLCVADVSSMTDFAWRIGQDEPRSAVRLLRSRKMRNTEELFNEFSAALQFPYYFGETWNAFDECLTDLSWLPADGYLIVILGSDELLAHSQDSGLELRTLLRLLDVAGREWATPTKQGEAWDRNGKPFHVIFHVERDKTDTFELRLREIGAELPKLEIG
jgi:hypothetical protein